MRPGPLFERMYGAKIQREQERRRSSSTGSKASSSGCPLLSEGRARPPLGPPPPQVGRSRLPCSRLQQRQLTMLPQQTPCHPRCRRWRPWAAARPRREAAWSGQQHHGQACRTPPVPTFFLPAPAAGAGRSARNPGSQPPAPPHCSGCLAPPLPLRTVAWRRLPRPLLRITARRPSCRSPRGATVPRSHHHTCAADPASVAGYFLLLCQPSCACLPAGPSQHTGGAPVRPTRPKPAAGVRCCLGSGGTAQHPDLLAAAVAKQQQRGTARPLRGSGSACCGCFACGGRGGGGLGSVAA